jgi:glycosyltransferase involved in cell wall biosynthesis
MLCGKPVVAAKAGGATELVEHGINGFLTTPGEPQELANIINSCLEDQHNIATIANNAQAIASERFDVVNINRQIAQVLSSKLIVC